MRCHVFVGSIGLLLVPDCMQASMEAERAYGPLEPCGAFETGGLEVDLQEQIDHALDEHSFATMGPDLAMRLGYDPDHGLPLPPDFAWENPDFWEGDGRAALLYVAGRTRVAIAQVVPDAGSHGWYAVTWAHRPWAFRGTRVTLSRPAALQFLSIWVKQHAQELRHDFAALAQARSAH